MLNVFRLKMSSIKKVFIYLISGLSLLISAAFYNVHQKTFKENDQFVEADTLMVGLTVPWDICFLPSGDMIFTERSGAVRLYSGDILLEKPVIQVPGILVDGKMGLLGMCIHPDFSRNKFVYLAYNYKENEHSFLRVARYKYVDDELIEPKTIMEHIPAAFNHTGCRLKFAPDHTLMITTGDADVPRSAQDLKTYNGKILRVNDDGSVPVDNPFVKSDTAKHEIWSYGHRNSQGIAFYPGSSRLFNSEHGPTGGDEINEIKKGSNYGWPIIHHREEGGKNMLKPLMEFSPSIGPAEAVYYSGKVFSSLKGDLLVACMRGECILDVKWKNGVVSSYQFILKNEFGRIRALNEGPDGLLYLSTSQVDPPESRLRRGEKGYDMIIRLRPARPGETKKKLAIDGGSDLLTTAIVPHNKVKKTDLKTAAKTPQALYASFCASCHGDKMEGKLNAPGLIAQKWRKADAKERLQKVIATGVINKGMPVWSGVLTTSQINEMTGYIIKLNQ